MIKGESSARLASEPAVSSVRLTCNNLQVEWLT